MTCRCRVEVLECSLVVNVLRLLVILEASASQSGHQIEASSSREVHEARVAETWAACGCNRSWAYRTVDSRVEAWNIAYTFFDGRLDATGMVEERKKRGETE